jgi:ribonuclease Z
MKTSFLPRLINGQTGDPALFVDLLHEKRALLFDCGTLTSLSPAEVLRTTDVFITHAHIDHFVGFDFLLRLHLGRGKRVRIYGPPGIIQCVRGKLSGYTWNLVKHQRLVFEVREFDGQRMKICEFLCRYRFRPSKIRQMPESDVLLEDDIVTVRARLLDHRTACLAFVVNERDFYNVDPVELKATGKRPGPWLNELKHWVRQGRVSTDPIIIDDQPHSAAELADKLLIMTRGKTVAYVADVQGNLENNKAIIELVEGADYFFCEGGFLHQDLERAHETFHLTARQAGELARQAKVKRLVVFHFSPKYEGQFEELNEEAQRAFNGE